MTETELLAKAVDEFQNEADDEWGLNPDDIGDFIYWIKNQERYKEILKYFLV